MMVSLTLSVAGASGRARVEASLLIADDSTAFRIGINLLGVALQ